MLFESRFTASEILDAIRYLRFEQHTMDESTGHLDEDERWLLNQAS